MKNVRSRTIALVALLTGLTALAGPGTAAAQIQQTPDSARYLIQRFVEPNEQWAISYNFEDGTMTGNVFKTDGGDPSFIWCEFTDIQYAENPEDNVYTLDCFGADACTGAPCDESQWNLIATGIELPASFVLPQDTLATYGGQVQPIFSQSCAFAGCHDGNTSAAGLNLSPDVAYDNIFRILSNQRPTEDLVRPFSTSESYLYAKLIGTGEGSMMPLGGMLSDEQLRSVENWIIEGAARN